MKLTTFLGTLTTVALSFGAGVMTTSVFAPDLVKSLTADQLPEAVTARLAAVGDFTGTSTIHRGAGRAQLLEGTDVSVLRLIELRVTDGPDLELWLLERADVTGTADVLAAEAVSLGPLQSATGDQIYLMPEGLSAGDYGAVGIWSASARMLFAVAPLERDTDDGAGEVSDG